MPAQVNTSRIPEQEAEAKKEGGEQVAGDLHGRVVYGVGDGFRLTREGVFFEIALWK